MKSRRLSGDLISNRKVEAVRRYRSQLRRPPFHASSQGLQTTAAFYGGQVSVGAAEAFQALRLAW